MDSQPVDVTQLLNDAAAASRASSEQLLSLVYDELRKIAQQRMTAERAGHTLQATALVHEAWLRLAGDRDVDWAGRAHFFAAAAEAMRRILIEHARMKGREKRGGRRRRVPLNVVDLAVEQDPTEILALDEAICGLERDEPQVGRVVRLRFFAGLTIDETARALGVSPRTVDSIWKYARARLFQALHGAVEA